MACSSNVAPVGTFAMATGQAEISVDRFAANTGFPSRSVSYHPGSEATSGRFSPGRSVPRAKLLAVGAARKVTALAACADGTTQSAANADCASRQSPNNNARTYPETANDREAERVLRLTLRQFMSLSFGPVNNPTFSS